MPRVKGSPQKCVKSQQASNTWLFIMKGDGLGVSEGCKTTPDVVKLRHPQTGSQAMFLFSADESKVQEVLSFSESKRSWVIDECVKSDGKMHLSTPMDPIFLVLPYLCKSAGRYEPLDQLLSDEDFPETTRLLRCVNCKQLSQVADCKGDEGDELYRINEEKALIWLGKKVKRVAEVLKQKGIHVGSGAISANFVRGGSKSSESTGTDSSESVEFIQYAHGVVAEYLSADLSGKLRKNLGLPEEQSAATKRKLATDTLTKEATPDSKKQRTAETESSDANLKSDNGILDLTKPSDKGVKPAPKKETAKDRARAKAAAGTQSITSFFKKK